MTMKSTVIKRCQRCRKEISLSDYQRNKTKADGHNGIFANCQREVNRTNR
ncbi:hypothetical protein [Rossellomorea sp. KS-H15a]|nr:hypothetical protein [Rossellomorea sp. KS-H15a]UTE77512.1 hypothetical protein M1J35_01455 [Rossellomorea sp. KS-H15a]